ncbi:leucine-rich repeat domain-containing protein [Bacteroides clarus]|jgi:hypothetical protein|uniref:Leucine-rich repeat domain-containing protein n=1 Tax=Bacteroides clarus TaxID=626929 RepID=A0A1Y3YTW5_9BACE|nr:leucine-rich repeat domain-containing protein [Bacteroides clarus]OUN99958.1 hypothetical protein B5F97_14540 [Bacteroides clarus]
MGSSISLKNLTWILISVLLLFITSCSKDEDAIDKSAGSSEKEFKTELISMKVGIESLAFTYTYFDFDSRQEIDDGIKQVWNEQDKIRVYWKDKDNTYHSAVFTLKSGVGTVEGVFEGMAPSSLPDGGNYEVLYPADKFPDTYSEDDSFKCQLELPLTGQKQVGNNNTAHLWRYSYMRATLPALVDFSFKQDLMGLLKLKLAMNTYDFATHGEIIGLSLIADRDIFISQGSNDRCSKIDLELEDITLESEKITSPTLTVYIMTYPTELLKRESYTVSVKTRSGISFGRLLYQGIDINSCSFIRDNNFGYTQVNPFTHTIEGSGFSFYMIDQAVGKSNPIALTVNGSDDDYIVLGNWLQDHSNVSVTLHMPFEQKIPDNTFNNCAGLTSINIPSVASIGDDAFVYCENLSAAILPSVLNIGDGSFRSCYNLFSIDIPTVTSIGDHAFVFCDKLSSLDLPSVVSIGEGAFNSCRNLGTINLPTVTNIEFNAFSGCEELFSVNLPSVTHLYRAFRGCKKLSLVSLTSREEIYIYDSFDTSTDIDLTLHKNKKSQVSGLTWNNLTWKSIRYVDDSGYPIIG